MNAQMVKQNEFRGIYLYAVVSGCKQKELGNCGVGENNVYTIVHRDLAAVVSVTSLKKVRPERRHLAAHNAVHRRLNEVTTPLPVSFGTIAENEVEIKKILSLNYESFAETLQKVEDRMEMGLRVSVNVPNIFAFLVDRHPDLKRARDELAAKQGKGSREEQINLGQLFERILEENREKFTSQVESILGPVCHEIKRLDCRDEKLIMNLACLVSRENEKAFERMIFEAANGFDDNYSFDFNGPFVPYNFVELEISF